MTPLVPQRRGVGRWPVTLTTERANPLRQWNPGWGGCSAARRPAAAANKLFLRRSVFVKRFTHEMTLLGRCLRCSESPEGDSGRQDAPQEAVWEPGQEASLVTLTAFL
jgi:hypothetical protein